MVIWPYSEGELDMKHPQSATLAKAIAAVVPSSLLILIVCSAAMAQGGGKAEPNRIEFKRGTTSAGVNGTVRGDEQAEYVLAAKKGQTLTIKITSVPARTAGFDLHGPEDVDLGLEFDTNLSFSRRLPKTGDYLITIVKLNSAIRVSKYTMTVTVR
jgi:hypothetical protein